MNRTWLWVGIAAGLAFLLFWKRGHGCGCGALSTMVNGSGLPSTVGAGALVTALSGTTTLTPGMATSSGSVNFNQLPRSNGACGCSGSNNGIVPNTPPIVSSPIHSRRPGGYIASAPLSAVKTAPLSRVFPQTNVDNQIAGFQLTGGYF